MDLYRINLNLLIALDTLLHEQSVTRAAKKLFITQAAMSNNLQQLRELFKDDLLLRDKKGMLPTAFARELHPKLHQVLQEVHSLIVTGQRFTPETSTRVFKIGVPDYMATLLFERVALRLQKQAPHVRLTLLPCPQVLDAEHFERCDFELALGKVSSSHEAIVKHLLFKDKVMCLFNMEHPLARKETITLNDFLSFNHIAICSDIPGYQTLVDQTLLELKKSRNITMGLPFISPIFKLLEIRRDLIATAIAKIADLYQDNYNFVARELPFKMPKIEFHLSWHRRHDNDRGHTWLRQLIIDAFEA